MITYNSLISFPMLNSRKKADNQSKSYNRETKSNFEDILSSKKDDSNYSDFKNRSNFKNNSISNKKHDYKKMQPKDNTRRDQFRDSDFEQINQNSQTKDTKTGKAKDERKTDTNLEDTGSENEVINNYSCSPSLALNIIGFENEDIVESTEKVTENLLPEIISLNLITDSSFDGDIETEKGEQSIAIAQESTESKVLLDLDDILNQDYEITNNQENEIIQVSMKDKEESQVLFEPEELAKNTAEETKFNSLLQKSNIDVENKTMDKLGNLNAKIVLNEKDFSLKSVNEEKDLVNSKEIQLVDDIDTQTNIRIKEHNGFSHFNDNNFNFFEKDLSNELNLATKQGTTILDKENIFEQIVDQVKIDMGKKDEIRIKLKPDFLGEISLKLSSEKGVITAKAYVENYSIKQLIESNLDTLKESMKELGLKFEALDVSVGKDSGFEKNNKNAWKQTQRIKTNKHSIDNIKEKIAYEENVMQIVGGLYSAEGNIDITI
ncbi:MAG: flagellar hook-length control protein FliK [Tissierellales bacterium]